MSNLSKGSFKEINKSKPNSSKDISKQNITSKEKKTNTSQSISGSFMPKFEDPKVFF